MQHADCIALRACLLIALQQFDSAAEKNRQKRMRVAFERVMPLFWNMQATITSPVLDIDWGMSSWMWFFQLYHGNKSL